jgi:hypothetical protein
MHPRFEGYRNTELGKAIESIARKSQRLTEYELLSRLGMPAVIALSWDLEPLLRGLSKADRRNAKQFCGAVVGDIMRDNGYEISNPRGSAQAGGVFTLGAIWAPAKRAKAKEIARRGFRKYADTFRALAK